MNKSERAMVKALSEVKIRTPHQRIFVRAIAWLAEHEATTVLSPAQKFFLESLVWHFRRRLCGCDGFKIPEGRPRQIDYQAAHAARGEKRRAKLEAKHGPAPVQGELF